jgi:hypothetical protein
LSRSTAGGPPPPKFLTPYQSTSPHNSRAT